MKNTPAIPYKEARAHGTSSFPCAYYRLTPQNLSSDTALLVKHHWHKEIELIYLQKGSFHLEINMDKYDIEEECFCFINSGELHFLSSPGDFHEKAFVFSPSMLAFAAEDLAQHTLIQPIIDSSLALPRLIRKTDAEFEELKHIFLHMSSPFDTPQVIIHDGQILPSDPIHQLQIKAGFLQILALLAASNNLSRGTLTTDRRIEMIKKVITHMENHFSERIYIHDLADLLNINDQYFCRFFKKIIGKSPIAYLNEIRMKHAAKLLLETDISVMDISLECGFNSLGNFMEIFKNTYGITPLQFRKSRISY